jgi:large subunit ribosomal protein L34
VSRPGKGRKFALVALSAGWYDFCSFATSKAIPEHRETETVHYPRRISNRHRARKIGFRARMSTRNGRKLINRKRRKGRKVQVV